MFARSWPGVPPASTESSLSGCNQRASYQTDQECLHAPRIRDPASWHWLASDGPWSKAASCLPEASSQSFAVFIIADCQYLRSVRSEHRTGNAVMMLEFGTRQGAFVIANGPKSALEKIARLLASLFSGLNYSRARTK
jgi:hypothetical protein